MQFLAPIVRANVADYSSADFYAFLTPIGVVVSIVLSILAIIGIWEKDNVKYFGLGGGAQEKTKVSEYIEIIKNNKPMQRLMVAWAITLLVMKGYTLTGPRMKEIQAINAARKEGIAKGMTLEEAMKKWQTIQDLE